ncbi:MAG: hypothetical protein IJ158_01865 [Treponema sp.]|nr:hypothetical protein [Treponema sp.]
MKKIIALVAAALISVTAAFSAEHTFHLGLPIGYGTDASEDDEGMQVGFHFDYTKVHENRFTFKAQMFYGLPNMKYSFMGVGLGFSPIANEKMTLSLCGDAGIGGSTFLTFGVDAMFTYRFNRHWGAFASLGAYTSNAPFVATLGDAFTIHPHGE